MNLPQQNFDKINELCCDNCQFKTFSSKDEYERHKLAHKNGPIVRLVKLSEYSVNKLRYKSYRVNNGVARRSNYVAPLKISLKKEKGKNNFQVITKQKNPGEKFRVSHRVERTPKEEKKVLKPRTESSANVEGNIGNKEVEGNNILERFGANISVTKRSTGLPVQQVIDIKCPQLDSTDIRKGISCKLNENEVLDRLLTGGISVAKQNSSNSNSSKDDGKLPAIVDIFSAGELKDQDPYERYGELKREDEAQKAGKNVILKKLNELGFSVVPKSSNKGDIGEQCNLNDGAEKENKVQKLHPVKNSDLEVVICSKGGSNNLSNNEVTSKCNSVSGRDSTREKALLDDISSVSQTSLANCLEKDVVCSAESEVKLLKTYTHVKNSKSCKKSKDIERQKSVRGANSGKDSKDTTVGASVTGEPDCFAQIPEEIKDPKSMKSVVNSSASPDAKGNENISKTEVNFSPGEELQSDFMGSNCISSVIPHCESQFLSGEDQSNRGQDNNDCAVLLGSPSRDGKNGESSRYSNVNCDEFRSESFQEENDTTGSQGDEVAVAYSSLQNEDQSISQAEQDPLTIESSSRSKDSLNQSFLQSFLNDPQPSQPDIQTEASEFMALERLGQVSGLDAQHCQANFDLSSGDGSTPMEQLSQQVQRLSNPPQINVIPQHHMQTPQPPQLHTGISPISQKSNSYDALGHLQPSMPPPLYQGFNMYNQNFPSQGPQQLPPRPQMLQQRPQLQARPFPGLAAPRPRHRSHPSKRNGGRMGGPPEMPKQRRVAAEQRVKGRSPPASLSQGPKIPSGITVTPTKKNLDASKVANVLASRGITVTPASGKQTTPSNRSQPRSKPILNIGPGVSITANSSNNRAGNFAMPSSRKTSPIVNQDVERPERCATVDLTIDDDPPVASINRSSGLRFPCNQCTKVLLTAAALETHKGSHRTATTLPYKCDKCTAQYPNATGLQQHKIMCRKAKQTTAELAIPIVDLNHPGVRDQLAKCGVHGFLPLSQLQSNSLGCFGVPILHLDSTKEKAIPNINSLGAANVLVLGKMKTLNQPQIP